MAQVTVRINGYAYTVGCEDGQEQHLTEMAAEVEKRVASIRALGGQSGEARLLMFAALMMADELHDIKIAADQSPAAQPAPVVEAPVTASVGLDEDFIIRLGRVAEEAERIAEQMEHA